MDSVSANVNTIRTVLPKSNREAAHSPPRHRAKVPILPSPLDDLEPTMSSSLPRTPTMTTTGSKLPGDSNLATVDDTSTSVYPQKTHLKMIKQRSFSSKTIYQSGNPMTTSRSSEQTTDSTLRNSHASQRMFANLDELSNLCLHRFE